MGQRQAQEELNFSSVEVVKEDRHQHRQIHGHEERRHVVLLFYQAHDGNTEGQISIQGMY